MFWGSARNQEPRHLESNRLIQRYKIYPREALGRPSSKFVFFSIMSVAKVSQAAALLKVHRVPSQLLHHFHLFPSNERYHPLDMQRPRFAKFHSLSKLKSHILPSVAFALSQHISATPLRQSSLVLAGPSYFHPLSGSST